MRICVFVCYNMTGIQAMSLLCSEAYNPLPVHRTKVVEHMTCLNYDSVNIAHLHPPIYSTTNIPGSRKWAVCFQVPQSGHSTWGTKTRAAMKEGQRPEQLWGRGKYQNSYEGGAQTRIAMREGHSSVSRKYDHHNRCVWDNPRLQSHPFIGM